MGTAPNPLLAPEQYLEIDSRAELPSEYYDGVMYPIEATSLRHSKILQKIVTGINNRLKPDSPCESFGPTARVRLPKQRYAYPDIVVVCGKIELDDQKYDTVLNPTMVLEVLSPSTGDFDRGGKAEMYRSIPSLREYVIVAQDRPLIEHFSRQAERLWTLEELPGLDGVLKFESIGIEIPLREVYERVEFDPPAAD